MGVPVLPPDRPPVKSAVALPSPITSSPSNLPEWHARQLRLSTSAPSAVVKALSVCGSIRVAPLAAGHTDFAVRTETPAHRRRRERIVPELCRNAAAHVRAVEEDLPPPHGIADVLRLGGYLDAACPRARRGRTARRGTAPLGWSRSSNRAGTRRLPLPRGGAQRGLRASVRKEVTIAWPQCIH